MLRFNITSKKESKEKEIHVDDMIFSEDLQIVTCIAEDDGTLMEQDKIKLYSTKYDEWKEIDIKVSRFTAIGEFFADTVYEVLSDSNSECKYVKFHDNRYYYNNESSSEYISIDGVEHHIQTKDDGSLYIVVTEKYLITSDKVKLYDGTECDIYIERIKTDEGDTDYSGSFVEVHYKQDTILSGESLVVYGYPKTFVRFTFMNERDEYLSVERAACADVIQYVLYDDKEYNVQDKRDGSDERFVYIGDGLSGTVLPYSYQYDEEKGKFTYKVAESDLYLDTYSSGITPMVKINDAENTFLQLHGKYTEADIGEEVFIYLSDTNVNLDSTERIIAKTVSRQPRYLILTEHTELYNGEPTTFNSIAHNGKFYNKKSVDEKGRPFYYVTVGDSEYEFHFLNGENEGYINYEDKVMFLNISNSIDNVVSEYRNSMPQQDDSRIRVEFANQTQEGVSGGTYGLERLNVICNNIEEKKYGIITYYDNNKPTFAYVPYEYLLTRKLYNGGDGDQIIISNPVYGIKRYDVIDVEGTRYRVYSEPHVYGSEEVMDDRPYEYILFDQQEFYELKIQSIIGNNTILCKPIVWSYNEDDMDNMGEYRAMFRTICYDIATNYDSFVFYIENNFSPYQERLDFSRYYSFNEDQPMHLSNLHFLHNCEYISIPLFASQDEYPNLMQEDNVHKYFTETETAKAINGIVDMDKDVYYPYHIKGNTRSEVNGIYFNLHFRTRTLDTWTVKEDYTSINGDNSDGTILPSFNEANTNWFCFDYYSGDTAYNGYSDEGRTKKQSYGEFDIDKKPSEAWKHSDLLYFLHFTNNDVYYQKKKLSNSFIRLMFYDTKTPSNQSLLYQATIWYDSSKAYKKYIDNSEINDYFDFDNNTVKLGIGVGCEPYDAATSAFTYDDSIRLDSQFYVKNRYRMNDSAEGFYLHLFKDLLDGVCSRTIYMKVVFNHAGEGKSCLFMLPHAKDGDKTVPWYYSSENVENLKKGVSLQDVFDYVYIPINIEYDLEKDKYIYYLSEDVATFDEDNNLIFNLFEIKMKDESNSQENNP